MTTREVMVSKNTEPDPERLEQRLALPPPVDIFESSAELLIVVDLPGVRQDDVDVRFEKNQLHLRGRACWPAGNAKTGVELDWARSFALPGGVDADHISAELKNGVLSLRLPKRDSLKPRQINVRAG